ncbi:hypothetical protein ABZ714_30750 [Streptomyces sp. NPDC006798]|uniref:hypothetical protein n=1 Tax=unclassified Streptomyces TaxID=2593676 RepID=UPI00332A6154
MPLLTWRELGVYVRQLPPDSRTALAQHGPDARWGLSEHLQALAIDELRVANWQRQNEGVKSGKQSKPPVPIDRPGATRKGSDKNSPERRAARARARQRAAEREAAIARGEIT